MTSTVDGFPQRSYPRQIVHAKNVISCAYNSLKVNEYYTDQVVFAYLRKSITMMHYIDISHIKILKFLKVSMLHGSINEFVCLFFINWNLPLPARFRYQLLKCLQKKDNCFVLISICIVFRTKGNIAMRKNVVDIFIHSVDCFLPFTDNFLMCLKAGLF